MATVKAKISRSSKPGKRLKAVYTNPKTGKENTVHFGQTGSNINPDKKTRDAFMARHKDNNSPAGQLSKKNWRGKGLKPGMTVTISI